MAAVEGASSARPQPLPHHHQQQQPEEPAAGKDCLTCRITGTLTCLGVGTWLAMQTYAKPPASPIQRRLNFLMAGALGALGVARALI